MALNKFEKQIQQKLNNREMKPSANSWDRLDAMLSLEEKPKKKGFFWINMAASFIVLASIGYYFYNQNSNIEPIKEELIIVGAEQHSEFNIENSENSEENIRDNKGIKEVLVENDVPSGNNQNSPINKQKVVIIAKSNNQQPIKTNKEGVSIINKSSEKTTLTNLESNNQQLIEQNKYISAEKLLADVTNTKFEEKKADKGIQKNNKRISINPNVLLSNAETELNQSYKESALDKLNKNFNSIKTVLANRNYEDEL